MSRAVEEEALSHRAEASKMSILGYLLIGATNEALPRKIHGR